ncbi:MAG: RsmE family RNA methyltransferase [Deltaproteobacteria bacterium]|nr:RsmE family RNA methyltransferase [Deltaproteobacteria bacterium]
MTVLRLRLREPAPLDGRLVVRGREHRYLSRVRRARPGESVEVLDGAGARLRGTIGSIGPDETVLVDLAPPAGTAPPLERAPVPLTLALGLGRPEPLVRIVRAAAELAVARIVPVRCARELRRDDRALDSLVERWRRVASEALRIGGLARAPEVAEPMTLEAWCGVLEPSSGRLCLDAAGEPLADALRQHAPAPSWAMLVGPEGGFEEAEEGMLDERGFRRVSLCPMPLRVETAAVGAMGVFRAVVG